MSKRGLKAAKAYGNKLNDFKNVSEAKEFFFYYKDCLLNRLESICLNNDIFTADYSVGSLSILEKWYFELYEKKEFGSIGSTREEFEKMLDIYFGEVAVKNSINTQWIVREYPFAEGKYEFLINKEFMSINAIGMFQNLCIRQGNKKRNLMLREYNKYFNR